MACVLYSFELIMLGVILLGAMAVCGCALWRRRRREDREAAERARSTHAGEADT